MEDEEAANSVHGKLVMEENDMHEDKNHANSSAPPEVTKSPTTTTTTTNLQEFKLEINIPKSVSISQRCRQRRTRECVLCALLTALLISASIAFTIIYLGLQQQQQQNTGSAPIVRTSLGDITGRYVAVTSGNNNSSGGGGGGVVAQYLGIPFAAPPVGLLRYSDPLPLDRLPSDPYPATDIKSSCMQKPDQTYGDFIGLDMWNPKNPIGEDCLYLNVWVPAASDQFTSGVNNGSAEKGGKAVMVWIYGGGFFSGSNALWVYDGMALAAHGDVIVVSINYRFGSFGFLSTGDGRVKGNFGLKDQVVGLRWVRDHIASFGGDPGRVTLFGESSGASSAGLHQMSTHSRDLFQRVVYQSGSPDAPWSFMSRAQARRRSADFLKAVNCSDAAPRDQLMDCLRKLDAAVILDKEWVTTEFLVFPWVPTIDGDFLTASPRDLLRQGHFGLDKQVLLGANADEGTFWILFALPGFSRETASLHDLEMYRQGVRIIAWDLNTEQLKQVQDRYLPGDGRDPAANRDALDKVSGDRCFTCPTLDLTTEFARRGLSVYFYYLTYRASNEQWPPWMGVIHGADIQWVFGMPLNESRDYTKDEVEFSKTVMTYWTNFAKTGNPNGPGVAEWPLYTTDNHRYLEFRSPSEFPLRNTFREDYCNLWRSIKVRDDR